MASRPESPVIVKVRFESRDDGGLRAYSDSVPGFVLSHRDADLVRADVEPALETILSAMYGMPMRVLKATHVDDDAFNMPAHLCGPVPYVGLSPNC